MAIDPNKVSAKPQDRAALAKMSTAKLVQMALALEIPQDNIPDDKNELISMVMKADRAYRLTLPVENADVQLPPPPSGAEVDAAKAKTFEAALAEGKAARKDGEAEVSGMKQNKPSDDKPMSEEDVARMDDSLSYSKAIRMLDDRIKALETQHANRKATLHGSIDDLKHS